MFHPNEGMPLTEVIEQALSLLSAHVIIAHAKDYSTVDGLHYTPQEPVNWIIRHEIAAHLSFQGSADSSWLA